MFTRTKPLVTLTALSILLCGGSAVANETGTRSASSSASQQASLNLHSAAEEERLRVREEELRLVEWARKERERKAADEEKLRFARRQRAEETFGGPQSSCTIRPVMSDGEIEACRRAGR